MASDVTSTAIYYLKAFRNTLLRVQLGGGDTLREALAASEEGLVAKGLLDTEELVVPGGGVSRTINVALHGGFLTGAFFDG